MVGYNKVVEYQELEDHQLIHWIALAEKEALEALYGRYSSSVFSLAMYMLKQEALAEEVTQDIFLNIWLKASSYKSDRGAPRAWIMSVAHHKIVDVIRSRRRTLTVTDPSLYETLDLIPSSEIPVDEQVVRNLERERILKALSTLPEPQRQVIMLAYFGGYSQSEMAEMLQQPLGTVKTRVRLAMQKLRGVLERDVHD
ncbi:MAG: sigma-70 family RNA polymerase sigma factor [Chloroflexi bacterium]|nr:sigma-70 family RNA polymerase sigma factor [Chloroflexota bacterium]MCI0880049.1 sigma-70 family RNA polymerase sigma factor [Chloroflexota bacterium]